MSINFIFKKYAEKWFSIDDKELCGTIDGVSGEKRGLKYCKFNDTSKSSEYYYRSLCCLESIIKAISTWLF